MSNALYQRVRAVRAQIEQDTSFTGGHPQRRKALERDLLYLLETGEETDDLSRFRRSVRGMGKVIEGLARDINERHALPKAIYATRHLGWTVAKALDAFGPLTRALREAEALARDLGVKLGSFSGALDPTTTPWIAELEAERERVRMIIDQRAMADLVLPAIEAHQVARSKKVPYTEVGGLCFGHVRWDEAPVHGKGVGLETVIHVSWCVPMQRAQLAPDSVTILEQSEDVLISAAGVLMPHVEYLGGFHSHPFKRVRHGRHSGERQMHEAAGWELSEEDRQAIRDDYANAGETGRRPLLEIIVSVGEMDRVRRKAHDSAGPHTFQFVVDKLRVVLGAFVVRADGEAREVDRLVCWWNDASVG